MAKNNKSKKRGGDLFSQQNQPQYNQPQYNQPVTQPASLTDKFNDADNKVTNGIQQHVSNAQASISNAVEPVTKPVGSFFSNMFEKVKNLVKKPNPNQTIGASVGVQPSSSQSLQGGRRKRRGGGFRPSHDYGIATTGAPVYGMKTVTANAYIGGKKSKMRKSRKSHKKSRKIHKKK